jgi:hypothetical protein
MEMKKKSDRSITDKKECSWKIAKKIIQIDRRRRKSCIQQSSKYIFDFVKLDFPLAFSIYISKKYVQNCVREKKLF